MATARVFSAGAIVIYEVSAELELTQTVAEDINNFADAIATGFIAELSQSVADDSDNYADAVNSQLFGVLDLLIEEDADNFSDGFGSFVPTLHFTDDINNFSDALGIVGLDYVVVIVDTIPALVDALQAFYSAAQSISDDANNWLDAVNSSITGQATQNPGDDIAANLGDDVQFILGLELQIGDFFTVVDGSEKVLGYHVEVEEDADNFLDDLSTGGLNELQLVLADSVNYFEDSVSPQYSRRNPTERTALKPYIRRYLNDVEVN